MVCDTNRAYFDFLRKEFSEYDFIYFSERDSLEEYDYLIFFKNKSLGCFEFLNAFDIKVPVIVAIFDELDFYLKVQLWEKGVVRFVSTKNSKIEIKNQLKVYFETCRY